MKKQTALWFLSIFSIGVLCLTGYAAEGAKPMDHSGHAGKESPAPMDHSGHIGERIHESTVEGYRLAYHLLALPGRSEKHLMVYITDANGKPVADATVGYLVDGPDGTQQRVMAMGMKDAFGADVNFTAKGKYTVKSKAVFGETKLLDGFVFEVK